MQDRPRHLLRPAEAAERMARQRARLRALGVAAAGEPRASSGVSIAPGTTALTRMPSAAWSTAMVRVSARIAPFAAM